MKHVVISLIFIICIFRFTGCKTENENEGKSETILPSKIDLTNVIPQPVATNTPVYSAETTQFTLEITWKNKYSPVSSGEFAPLTEYTATALIRAKPGYTLNGYHGTVSPMKVSWNRRTLLFSRN